MLPSDSEALRNLSTWREPQINWPAWTELASEADLPPDWREQWRWPVVPSADRRELVVTLARFLIPKGVFLGSELVGSASTDEEIFAGTEDLFDDQAREFSFKLFGHRDTDGDQASVLLFSHGLTIDPEDSMSRRIFFGMKGKADLLHMGLTRRQFKELTGATDLLTEPKIFVIEGGLIAKAFPIRSWNEGGKEMEGDVDVYIHPFLKN